jgi:hypothetical protein
MREKNFIERNAREKLAVPRATATIVNEGNARVNEGEHEEHPGGEIIKINCQKLSKIVKKFKF